MRQYRSWPHGGIGGDNWGSVWSPTLHGGDHLKIIDFECKGNMVRFYLGKESELNYHGDDWNDAPYDRRGGTVYEEYITGTADLVFPFDALVLEPCAEDFDCRFCKDDMKAGIVPCIIVVPGYLANGSFNRDFDYWATCKGIHKFYMNDRMEPTTEPALYYFDPHDNQLRHKNYTVFMTRKTADVSSSGGDSMKEIPIWEKANLTIDEAAVYFNIGKNKLSELTKIRNCNFVLYIGTRRLIKRKQFEAYLERHDYL